MAIKIERGGWILIFLIGVALVAYSLNKYGVLDLGKWIGSGSGTTTPSAARLDTSKPLPTSGEAETNEVRVRVNIWVGCVPGLVANGGLDTAAGSIYANKGLKVSFKIIDDWTEGAAALATGNVDQQKMKIEEEAQNIQAGELVKQFKIEMGLASPSSAGASATPEKTIGGKEPQRTS